MNGLEPGHGEDRATWNTPPPGAVVSTSVFERLATIATDREQSAEEERDHFFTQAQDPMCVANIAGYFVRVNPAFTATLGWSAEELLSRPIIDFIHPDDQEATEAQGVRQWDGVTTIQFENRYQHKDGSWRWFSWNATPILADGLTYAVARDITEQRCAKEALRQSEERFRLLFDAAPTGVALAAPDGHLLEVNQALCQMLGYSAYELLEQGTPILTHPDDLAASRALIDQLLDGEMRTTALEKRYLHHDGHVIWTHYTATLLRDEAGQPLYFIFHLQDITARKEAEEARALLATIVEASDDAIFGKTLDGVITAWNVGAERLYGYLATEIIGQSVARLIPPERPGELAALMRAVARGETVRQYETERLRRDGSRVAVALTITPIHDQATGAVVSASVVARDITARCQAEEALRHASERRAAIIATQQQVAAAGLEIETVLTQITARTQELTGASGAVVELIAGEEMIYRAASGSAAAHVGLRLAHATSLSGLCTRADSLLRCDDTEMDERVDQAACRSVGARSMILVPLRQAGQTVGVLKVLSPRPRAFGEEDVEALQLMAGVLGAALGQATAFDALRASEERYRQVEAHAPIGLALVAPDGRFLRVNPALCRLVGYGEQDLLMRSFQDITHPDDLAADLAYVRQMLTGEIATYQMEKRYFRKDSTVVWILLSVSLVRDEAGQPLYFIAQIQDIDARKRAEEALHASNRELARSNAELEQFSRVASHDLRSPLNSIGGFAQLLQMRYQGRLDTDADEYIGFITSGVARMQALIDALLAYARLDSQAKPFAPVDCVALVRDALANLHAALEETETTVEIGALPTVMGDATQLGQLVQNLIGNALKFRRPDVAPVVRVWAEHDGEHWRVAVRDNGIGIDPAHAARVFEMFGRLHTREEYEGTGIGLAVCQKIVERHGGRIWLESEPGVGATFLFTLPAA